MRYRLFCQLTGVALAVLSLVCVASAGDDPADFVTKHLDSIGTPETRLANTLPCLIGMEACVGAHHLARQLKTLGHETRPEESTAAPFDALG